MKIAILKWNPITPLLLLSLTSGTASAASIERLTKELEVYVKTDCFNADVNTDSRPLKLEVGEQLESHSCHYTTRNPAEDRITSYNINIGPSNVVLEARARKHPECAWIFNQPNSWVGVKCSLTITRPNPTEVERERREAEEKRAVEAAAAAEAERIRAEAAAKAAAIAAAEAAAAQAEAEKQAVIAAKMGTIGREAMVEMKKRTAAREKLAAQLAGPQAFANYQMGVALIAKIHFHQISKVALDAKHRATNEPSNSKLASDLEATNKKAFEALQKADHAHLEAEDAAKKASPDTFANYHMQLAEILRTASNEAAQAALDAHNAAALDTNNKHLTEVSGSMAKAALTAKLLSEQADVEARLAREKAFEAKALAHIEQCVANSESARAGDVNHLKNTVNVLCNELGVSPPKEPEQKSVRERIAETQNANKFSNANTSCSQPQSLDQLRKLNLEELLNHLDPKVQAAAKELVNNPDGAARVEGMMRIHKMLDGDKSKHKESAPSSQNAKPPAKKWAPVEAHVPDTLHTHIRKPQSDRHEAKSNE